MRCTSFCVDKLPVYLDCGMVQSSGFDFRFSDDVKVVHFIGASKPWHMSYNTATGDVSAPADAGVDPSQHKFLQLWWSIFMQDIQNTLQSDLVRNVAFMERCTRHKSMLYGQFLPKHDCSLSVSLKVSS